MTESECPVDCWHLLLVLDISCQGKGKKEFAGKRKNSNLYTMDGNNELFFKIILSTKRENIYIYNIVCNVRDPFFPEWFLLRVSVCHTLNC